MKDIRFDEPPEKCQGCPCFQTKMGTMDDYSEGYPPQKVPRQGWRCTRKGGCMKRG